MDHLFTPWRYSYVTGLKQDAECVFCRLGGGDPSADAASFVVHRGRHHFVVLNVYPYTSGHVMLVPYQHADRLSALSPDTLAELMQLAVRTERVLERVYRPEGINFGLNLGKCAGAGLETHLHLHAVPRWFGDTSFMSVTAETRVLPESLEESWRRVRAAFDSDHEAT